MDALQKHGHGHSHGQEPGSGGGHGHGQAHGHGHGHGPHHARVEAPQTEGRLIREARFYDLRVWLMFLGQIGKLRALSLDLAELRPGERVLDVGCGTGDLVLAAARRIGPTGAVFGIDAAPEMIDVARGKARRRRSPAQFQVGTVERLAFPDASLDVALSSLMMHHLPGDLRRHALAEITRALRPGGRLIVVDLDPMGRLPRPWEPGWLVTRRHKLNKAHAHSHSHAGAQVKPAGTALGELLREAGFESVESGPTRYSWIAYARGRVPA